METIDFLTTKRPHPSPGWLAVQVVPESEIKPDEDKQVLPPEAVMKMMASKMGITVEELRTVMDDSIVGQIAGVVLEVGREEAAGDAGPNNYQEGDTIWFPADRGIEIGTTRFLRWERVIAYDREGDEE